MLLSVGFFFSLIALILYEYLPLITSIPVSLLLTLAGAVISFTAKPARSKIPSTASATSSIDRLAKLKELPGSCAITKEEFEERKRLHDAMTKLEIPTLCYIHYNFDIISHI